MMWKKRLACKMTVSSAIQKNVVPIARLDLYHSGASVKTGEPFEALLELWNLHPYNEIPPMVHITFAESEYFQQKRIVTQKSIPPDSSIQFNAQFRCQSGAAYSSFPGQLEYAFTIENTTHHGFATIPTDILRADFLVSRWGPVNVMAIGWKGAGKSALLNAITTCLSTKGMPTMVVLDAPSCEHVTTAFCKVSIAQRLHDEGCQEEVPLFLFDTWGDSDKDYIEVNYQPFLKGMIEVGATRRTLRKNGIRGIRVIPNRANEIHAVLVVTPITSYVETGTIEKLNKALNEVRELGYRPIVVITFDDTVEEQDEKLKHRKAMLSKLEADPMDVFFHSNYVHDKNRNISIDLSTRLILKAIWDHADQFKLHKGERHWAGIEWPKQRWHLE